MHQCLDFDTQGVYFLVIKVWIADLMYDMRELRC